MGKRRKGVVRHFMVRAQEGEQKRKVLKQGRSLKGRVTSNKECYYYMKKGHIQMMCTEMKEGLKKMKDLKVGRREGERLCG